MYPLLLLVFLIPVLAIPFVYFTAKKSSKAAGLLVALIALVNIGLIGSTIPTILNSNPNRWVESYTWAKELGSSFTLFTDGISASIAIVSLVLILACALFSINYMEGKKNLPVYYSLLTLLSVGLIGVFITSDLLLFYLCWELMLIPAYFIVGSWGYHDSYKAAFKLFIFTHIGTVFVLLGIGAVYMVTGTTDMFTAMTQLLTANSDIVRWVLLAFTAGFAVKMAIFPVHMWLPDAHSDAPAPMSALLSGVIISAGAYAIIRLSLGMVFPAVMGTTFAVDFLHGLAIFAVVSAFFGSLIAMVETDIKRVIAYSSIAHMGYILFGISLFPSSMVAGTIVVTVAITGTILHILSHALSKGLLFLSAGAIMHQTDERDITKMGGLAGKMPFTAVSSFIATLSIGGAPPFACFISEFFIFVGAFQVIQLDSFYILPTAFMLIATVLSLGYSLRFVSKVFFGQPKTEAPKEQEHGHKITDVPNYMKLAMVILVILVVIVGIWPEFFVNLINTVQFGAA